MSAPATCATVEEPPVDVHATCAAFGVPYQERLDKVAQRIARALTARHRPLNIRVDLTPDAFHLDVDAGRRWAGGERLVHPVTPADVDAHITRIAADWQDTLANLEDTP